MQITYDEGKYSIPDQPTVGVIVGDGIGVDITPVTLKVIDAAVAKAYGGKRQIMWDNLAIGDAGVTLCNEPLPMTELEKIKDMRVALKGPLSTPTGGGHRSLNVALRQHFNLFSCVRPVRHFKNIPSPMKAPEKLDIVIFRENTEDVYSGIEFAAGSAGAQTLRECLGKLNFPVPQDAGMGVKPISKSATERIVHAAITYALDNNRRSLTLVHKGNIMKFTEGAFVQWGYDYLRSKFADKVVFEDDGGVAGKGKVLVKQRIADAMFQQLLLRPDEYDVLVTMNLNGDYLSDAAAAQVGGLGVAPGANIGDGLAIFEATHGTAPKYAGLDKVNPSSLILSGVMMLEFFGWKEAASLVVDALEQAYVDKKVTYDLARQMDDASELSCSAFGEAVIKNMG